MLPLMKITTTLTFTDVAEVVVVVVVVWYISFVIC